MKDLIDRIAELDMNLALDVARALEVKSLSEKVRDAQQDLHEACEESYWDATGQDTEDLLNQCASDYISAQDDLWRAQTCPIQQAEMRMGA